MPWPGTNIPAPWDPAPPPAPPDTTQRDALLKQLTQQHGGQVGSASTPTVKNPKDPNGPDIPGPYDLYTFADGTTLEIAPTGEVSKYTPKDKTGTVTGWTDITQVRNPDQSITYYGRDPKDPGGPLKPVEGLPVSAAPTSAKQPSPSNQLDKIDAQGNVIQPGDTTTRPVSLRDPATGSVIDIPKDPAGSITAIGDTVYVVKPDGSSTLVTDAAGKPIAKTKDPSQFNVPGIGLVNYDPSSGKANVLIAAPTGVQARDLKPEVRGGKTYIPIDNGQGGITWQETNLPTDTTYTVAQNDPRSPNVLLIDQQGNSKFVSKGPDWKPPPSPAAGQALTPDTTSPFVVTIGDNGQPVFTENKNQVSISDAQKQLIQQLGMKVADGSMSEKQAQDLISSATSTMTAQAAQQNAQANILQAQTQQQRLGVDAATQALQGVQQGAQTGAGLLQNRVTAATGALNNAISAIAGSKMTSAPAGMGANLAGGLQEWVTQLGGGQPVYDSAAAMVNQANPAVKGDPTTAQQAYTALRGAMDLYKQQTGQDYVPKEQRQFTSPTTSTAEWSPSQPATTMQTAPFNPSTQPAATMQPASIGAQTMPQTGPPPPAQTMPQTAPPPPPVPMVSSGAVGPWAGGMTPPPGTLWPNPAIPAIPIPQTLNFRAPVTA